jgi:hypothetical protein
MRMRKRFWHRLGGIILATALATALMPLSSSALGTYAASFIDLCEGQQWFLDEIERLLNVEQKSINTLNSNADLSVVKSLGLRDRNITGQIPRAIGELTELRYLFLSGNKLNGTVPLELFSLPKLQNIDISGNSYIGAIPIGFGGMVALETLNLRGNGYTGTVPPDILSDNSLVFLDVSSNGLSGAMPNFAAMTSLEYLAVSDNGWTAGAVPDLHTLTSLKALSMWGCNRIGELPASLFTLTTLEVLDLGKNRLSGDMSGIASLVNLQYLSLGSNEFAGTIPDVFGSLDKLEILDLSNNQLRGRVPEEFADYDEVYVETNYLTGDELIDLAGYKDNFCDGAQNPQYRLTADSPRTISQTTTTNIYLSLRNRPLQNSPAKGILPADCYEAEILNDTGGKVTLTADATGILVKANGEVLKSENILLRIYIKDNNGSDYSTVTILLTTEVSSSGGLGGGDGEVIPEPEEEPEPTPTPEPPAEIHEPYINGYPDGTFGPGKNVTREQVAAMLIRILGMATSTPSTPPFPDVATERWSAPQIAVAKTLGYVQGYDDGLFMPDKLMTRAELATLLVRDAEARGEQFTGTPQAFTDVPADNWYAEYVAKASAIGLVNGYDDGTFRPETPVTRAEAVVMINRAFGRDPETAEALKTATCPFSDVSDTHWAYWHIMEASVLHEHIITGPVL